jgi:hypothetical protein
LANRAGLARKLGVVAALIARALVTDGVARTRAWHGVTVEIWRITIFVSTRVHIGISVVAIAYRWRADAITIGKAIAVSIGANACASFGQAGHGIELSFG